jgi:hypothetical protein
MRVRPLCSLLFAAAVLAASSCRGGAQPAPVGAQPAQAAAATAQTRPASLDAPSSRDAEIVQMTDGVMARARAHEPVVSAELRAIAAQVGGRLAGFEYRLKSRQSCLRKMRKKLHDHPDWQPRDAELDDALRYTIEVDDQPPGRHAEAIRVAFSRFEAAGHRVIQVKNYWPRGDNYSGVNAVMLAPDGLRWELQFHTRESFRIKMRDHHLYEELREVATSAARKRQLYFELAEPWNAVPIPQHMLDPKSLHRNEEIILRPPP